MTFEEFWLAAAESDEFMKILVPMENKHSEEAKEEIITQNEAVTNVLKNISDMRGADYIDRYAALAELNPQSIEYKIIKDLPSVVPSIFGKEIRPKGKWLDSGSGWKCSNCGFRNHKNVKYDNCPKCKADMREVKNNG